MVGRRKDMNKASPARGELPQAATAGRLWLAAGLLGNTLGLVET